MQCTLQLSMNGLTDCEWAVQGSVMPSSWALDCGDLLPTSPPPEPEAPVETVAPSESVEESFGGIIADAESPVDGNDHELQSPPPSPSLDAAADAVMQDEPIPELASISSMAAETEEIVPDGAMLRLN